MKKLALIFILLIPILNSSCEEDEIDYSVPLSIDEINDHLLGILEEYGIIDCADLSDHFLWSMIVQDGGVAGIGYTSSSTRQTVIDLILDSEKASNPDLTSDDIVVNELEELLHITIKIELLQTITLLRKSEFVRYVDAGWDKWPFEN